MRETIELCVFITRILFLIEIPFFTRISLIINAFFALFRMLLFKKKIVNYFGHNFIHESIVGPVLIYPYELSSGILRQIPAGEVKNVLDIGGNLGQFSVTLANMTKVENIDVIEPNPSIFGVLETNTSNYEQIKCYNLAIGKSGNREFYYEKGKSATGSFVKNNVSTSNGPLSEVSVKVTDKISSYTGRSKYDLIKIDVEGFEYDVIKNLKGIKTKYMFIEISTNREKPYVYSQILGLIAKTFGEFELLYQDYADADLNSFDILIEVTN